MILLLRHGVPRGDHLTRVRGCDFAAWVAAYESAPLDERAGPPAELCRCAADIACIVTSTMRRARESAALVAPGRPVTASALFDEAALPTRIPWRIALKPDHWDALARAAWLAGWSAGVESLAEASTRSEQAAQRLDELARDHGSVLLVGHGMMNTLILRALRRRGWRGSGSPRAYWGAVTLRLISSSGAA
jgi:broad specificity phosphatase PhoE